MNIKKQIGALTQLPLAAAKAGVAGLKSRQMQYDNKKKIQAATNKKMGKAYPGIKNRYGKSL